MMTLFATLLLCGAQAPAPPALPIAVTKSGLRVECSASTSAGDRRVDTPFGSLLLATDPVVEVVDGKRQLEDFNALHEQGVTDDETLLQDLSTAGQLSALEAAAAQLRRDHPQALYPTELLEAWGRRLDPVPDKVDYADRVAWLWDEAMKASPTRTLMLGARLREEVSTSQQPQFNRIISISTLRKGLRSQVPERRRVAALIAGKQKEFSLRESLLLASLSDSSEVARDGAAAAAGEIHPHAARQYWVRNLANGRPADRELAARNLGRYGGEAAIRPLIYVLAAWDHPAPQRFDFHGRTIWVVKTIDRNAITSVSFDPRRPQSDPRLLPEDDEFLDLGSNLRVGDFSESLLTALLEALDAQAGERTGRDAKAWLDWYQESWLPKHPSR